MSVHGAHLPSAPEDSVERAFPLSPGPQLADLRGARGREPGPERIRLSEGFLATPVRDAYDLVVSIPEITTSCQIPS